MIVRIQYDHNIDWLTYQEVASYQEEVEMDILVVEDDPSCVVVVALEDDPSLVEEHHL